MKRCGSLQLALLFRRCALSLKFEVTSVQRTMRSLQMLDVVGRLHVQSWLSFVDSVSRTLLEKRVRPWCESPTDKVGLNAHITEGHGSKVWPFLIWFV
jgi:hypothetical protein